MTSASKPGGVLGLDVGGANLKAAHTSRVARSLKRSATWPIDSSAVTATAITSAPIAARRTMRPRSLAERLVMNVIAIKAKAENLLKQLKGGADFAKLATENSADPGSAAKGGELGSFPRGVMVKAFDDAVFSMKPGEISAPVETDYGCHVIRVTGITPGESYPCGYFGPSPAINLGSDRAYQAIRGMTLEDFAVRLYGYLGRRVIDATGLSGYFDADFEFTIEIVMPPPPPGQPNPYDGRVLPSIFSVLPQQLGLKLESQRGPVDILVIDRAEHPDEN